MPAVHRLQGRLSMRAGERNVAKASEGGLPLNTGLYDIDLGRGFP